VVKRVDSGSYPEGIAASADGRYVYIAHWDDNTLDKLDTATLEIVAEAETGDGPRAFGAFIRH